MEKEADSTAANLAIRRYHCSVVWHIVVALCEAARLWHDEVVFCLQLV